MSESMNNPWGDMLEEEPPADYDDYEKNSKPAAAAGKSAGTLAVTFPGNMFGCMYGTLHVEVPLAEAASLPGLVARELLAIGQECFDAGNAFAGQHAPAQGAAQPAAASPQQAEKQQAPASGLLAQLAAAPASQHDEPAPYDFPRETLDDGIVEVTDQWNNKVRFPSPSVVDSKTWESACAAAASEVLGVPLKWIMGFDNRADMLDGGRSWTPCAIKFSTSNAPAPLQGIVVTNKGTEGIIATVEWDVAKGALKVKPTKDFKANSMKIATAAAPFLAG